MMNETNLLSWNVHGLKRVSGLVHDIMKKYDIVCIQETWLRKYEENLFNSILPDFNYLCKSSMDNDKFYRGRPFGGQCILWKNHLDDLVTPVDVDYDNICAISVTMGSKTVYIVNVYAPFNCNDNEDKIQDFIVNLFSIWELNNCDEIIICGDFNMHVDAQNFRFVYDICEDSQLCISILLTLTSVYIATLSNKTTI